MAIPIRKTCNLPDCEGQVVSNGLCDKHRIRMRVHGHTNSTRPIDWGDREKHPLYGAWTWRRRKHTLCKAWRDDFWLFVKDVHERPTPTHFLRRLDESKPYAPDNAEWVQATALRSETEREQKADYMRRWNIANVEKVRDSALRKMYGISLSTYKQMLDAQDGKCAICKKEEFVVDRKTDKVRELAVDHCHDTGTVRGLLCTNCNRGIGHFKDDAELLREAIYYLDKNQ